MNLWLRMLRIFIGTLTRPKIALLDTSRIRARVWLNDLDINLHLNNARYLSFADLGRLDWFIRSDVLKLARQHQAFPMIGDLIAKFRRDMKLFQTCEVQTRLVGWDHKWAFVEHRFVRQGRVLGIVAIRGVFKGKNGLLDPNTILNNFGVDTTPPRLPEWALRWNEGCELLSDVLRAEEKPQARLG
jgi:acyl-CoA thioesterase FadM